MYMNLHSRQLANAFVPYFIEMVFAFILVVKIVQSTYIPSVCSYNVQ